MEPFHIRFSFSDPERLEAAERAFARIQECKEKNEWPEGSEELEAWKPYFDSRALAYFWWPASHSREEGQWDFLSMIDAFRNGDYQLEGIETLGANEGRLTFDPFGWPYGGPGCMKAFLEAFGMTITEERC